MEKFTPIHRRIVIRKCIKGEKRGRYQFIGNISLPDDVAEFQIWAEINDVSDDCKLFTKDEIGAFIYAPEWKPNKMQRIEDEDFVIKEEVFENGEVVCAVFRTE